MKLVQPNERLEIDMLIHDCMQYAIAAGRKFEQNAPKAIDIELNWDESEDAMMHVIRLRKLKDELIRLNGDDPLPWAV